MYLIHAMSFQYVENVPKWGEQCELSPANPAAAGTSENSQQDISSLESTIHHHQSLYESMCQVNIRPLKRIVLFG